MADKSVQDEPELLAMSSVLATLKPLKEEERARVVEWVIRKLEIESSLRTKPPQKMDQRQEAAGSDEQGGKGEGETNFSDFADLCSAANPGTDAEKALVAGYWFQSCAGKENFGSQECNGQLKHFGTPIGNITRAFEALKSSKPSLAMQMHKSGKTKQGRKKYKLTTQGIQEVQRMINE